MCEFCRGFMVCGLVLWLSTWTFCRFALDFAGHLLFGLVVYSLLFGFSSVVFCRLCFYFVWGYVVCVVLLFALVGVGEGCCYDSFGFGFVYPAWWILM